MGSFGSVIPVTGLNVGFVGQISRTGGNPVILPRQANSNNADHISFGDLVVTLPDAAGGTFRALADFLANGGNPLTTATGSGAATTITVASANGLRVGQFVFGTGIAPGAQIVSIVGTTVTLSIANAGAVSGNISVATLAGVAVREVKTDLSYPITPGAGGIGYYAPGDMCEVLQEGSICVVVNVGTPSATGPVFARIAVNGAIPAGLLGDIEAAPDGSNTIQLDNAQWRTGVLDGNNVAELTLLSRQSA